MWLSDLQNESFSRIVFAAETANEGLGGGRVIGVCVKLGTLYNWTMHVLKKLNITENSFKEFQ